MKFLKQTKTLTRLTGTDWSPINPARFSAKKVPVRRAEPSFAEPSSPHLAPRAMGHQMTATESFGAEAEASEEEDEGQEGGDFD